MELLACSLGKSLTFSNFLSAFLLTFLINLILIKSAYFYLFKNISFIWRRCYSIVFRKLLSSCSLFYKLYSISRLLLMGAIILEFGGKKNSCPSFVLTIGEFYDKFLIADISVVSKVLYFASRSFNDYISSSIGSSNFPVFFLRSC